MEVDKLIFFFSLWRQLFQWNWIVGVSRLSEPLPAVVGLHVDHPSSEQQTDSAQRHRFRLGIHLRLSWNQVICLRDTRTASAGLNIVVTGGRISRNKDKNELMFHWNSIESEQERRWSFISSGGKVLRNAASSLDPISRARDVPAIHHRLQLQRKRIPHLLGRYYHRFLDGTLLQIDIINFQWNFKYLQFSVLELQLINYITLITVWEFELLMQSNCE